jgi:hypothetical protein
MAYRNGNNDWVPFEIAQAVDTYKLPIIAAYPATLILTTRALTTRLAPSLAVGIGAAHR